MKTINDKLSPEKARKELEQFSKLGLGISLLGLVFGFLGIASLAFCARAMILSRNKSNKKDPSLSKYRKLAIIGLGISIIDIAFMF